MSISIVLLPLSVALIGAIIDDCFQLQEKAMVKNTKLKSSPTNFNDTSFIDDCFKLQEKAMVKNMKLKSFPTNFNDTSLLIKTLEDFGASEIQQTKQAIRCTINACPLYFYQDSTARYHVEIQKKNKSKLLRVLSLLDIEYKKNVQALTYYNLKQRAAVRNWAIEHEEILNDNSIVITLSIDD